MDIPGMIRDAPFVDLIIFFGLLCAVVIGAMQGAIRRAIGIVAMLFAFLIASNVRATVGGYLADNWRQFPAGYDYLLAYIGVFLVIFVGASLITQGFYKRRDIYARRPVVDEVLGGVLGGVEGVLLVLIAIMIMSSYALPATPIGGEVPLVREVQDGLVNSSRIADAMRHNVVPIVLNVMGGLMPGDLVALLRP